ncbi:MAG: alternative ribosome rescue aminoacyl-tRNA hydrolase ArfB [Solirubrobacteraceae bacterium]
MAPPARSGIIKTVPEPLRIGEGIEIPVAELTVRTSRSSGPGGQHANVTASRVEVSFDVAGSRSLPEWARARLLERLGPEASAVAQDERSQARNRELALGRLAGRLAAALERPRPRRPTKPTRSAQERRLARKRRASERKRGRRLPPQD